MNQGPLVSSVQKVNLLGMNLPRLEQFFDSLGERSFRATQVMKWIHQAFVTEFEEMTNLSMKLRAKLADVAHITAPTIISQQCSGDGTRKWLLRIDAQNSIETVFIPEADRGTLCVSSQVGCPLDCQFCATAKQGFNRNLDCAGIIGQLWLVRRQLTQEGSQDQVSNVVMMGMGEPLLNFDPVVEAMDLMVHDNAHGLARRRVTLSTAGVVPGIYRLKTRNPVSLAVSLHAPDDELRDWLVPINRTFPISALLSACRDYVAESPKSVITFEYVMLAGINDHPHHARALAKLINGIPAKVNLIPFNPFEGSEFKRPGDQAIDSFKNILMERGFNAFTRKTRGADIDAACGQLAGRVMPRAKRIRRLRGLSTES